MLLRLAVLLAVLLASAATAQEKVRAPGGPDPYRGYTEAASRFGQAAWAGARDGSIERITLRLGEQRSGISLELPPGSAREVEGALTELIRAQGWDPGVPRRMNTDNGPVYTFRPARMTRARGLNEIEAHLELDPLVKGLEALGGKPRLFAVRTPAALEWPATPQPSGGGVFEGERYAFYTLKPRGNGTFEMHGSINRRRLLALLMSIGLWLLFPLLVAGAARLTVRPQPEAKDDEKRWKHAERALCWATAIGAFGTLSFQGGVLRLVPLLLPRLPFDAGLTSSLPIPFAFLFFYWALGAWRLLGPTAPPLRSKAMLKILGAGLGFLLLYGTIFIDIGSLGSRDPFSGMGKLAGGMIVLLGAFFIGTWLTIERKTRQAATEITVPKIPVTDNERRARLREMEEKEGSPETLAAGEKALAEARAEMRPFLEAAQALTDEEKSWLVMANQLTYEKTGRMGLPALRMLPISGGVLISAGIAAWFLPGILGMLLSLGACFALAPIWKLAGSNGHSDYTRSGADLAVARLLDDPYRYLDVLKRLESAASGTKVLGDIYRERRKALERALGQSARGRGPR